MIKKIALLLTLVFHFGCQQNDNSREYTLSSISDPKVLQYAIQGKQLYEGLCANCHQKDGTGLGKLMPPLKNSDYLKEDVSRTAKIIKFGQEGEIVVNGQNYNNKMPANPHLTNMEIAQIMTYIYNIWGNKKEVISAKEVEQFLAN